MIYTNYMPRGLFFLAAASLIWSTTPIFSKLAYAEGLHPIWLVEIRLIVGFLLFLAMGKNPLDAKADLRNVVLLALFGLSGNYLVYHLSIYFTTASSAQLLEGTAPVFVLLLAALMREESIALFKLLGVSMSAMGLLLIFASHAGSGLVKGDLLGIAAALTWAYFIVQGKRTTKLIAAPTSLTFLFGFSFLVLLPLAYPTQTEFTPRALLIAAAMGAIHTFLAYGLYLEGIRISAPSLAGVVFSLNPIATVLLANVILGEVATPLFYVGAALAIIGVAIVATRAENNPKLASKRPKT